MKYFVRDSDLRPFYSAHALINLHMRIIVRSCAVYIQIGPYLILNCELRMLFPDCACAIRNGHAQLACKTDFLRTRPN